MCGLISKSLLPPGGTTDSIPGRLALQDRLAHPLGAHSASPTRGLGDLQNSTCPPAPHCASLLALRGSMYRGTEGVVREERTQTGGRLHFG